MMMNILHKRDDGSFVIERDGLPYHVISEDPIFANVAAAATGKTFPPEPVPESPEPGPRVFSKRRFFLALTDEEYATFEAIEAQQPARDRRAFAEAAELNEASEDWPQFLALMHATYGEARTAEILDAAAI